MKMKNILSGTMVMLGASAILLYSACQPEEYGIGNGLSATTVDASFSATPVAGKTNTYVLQANTKGVLGIRWDLGDGSGFANGKLVDTVFYPDAGTYTVKSEAIGAGGVKGTSTKTITVATSDPVSGNLLTNGKMTAQDDATWTRLNITAGVTFTLNNGKMVAQGGNWGHAGVYTSVDVVANKKYAVDMLVSGSGATDTWFEVYVSQTAPVAGQDYSAGGKRLALNTWAGCATSPFSGKLSKLSCDAPNGNKVTFTTGGKVYILVKSGGGNLGTDGISFTNVEFRGVN